MRRPNFCRRDAARTMPHSDNAHRRSAAVWIGALLLILGLLLLAVELYFRYAGATIELPPDAHGNPRYFRMVRIAPTLMLMPALAIASTVVGVGLLIWARSRRKR
jgi:hypothetical protein